MALTPLSSNFELSAVQPSAGIDPREQMLTVLSQQNQTLLETMDKAQAIFQEQQTKQKAAIEAVSKTNDELQAALINAEKQNNQLQAIHQAEINALKEKHQLQINFILQEMQNVLHNCETLVANIKQIPDYVNACNFKNVLRFEGDLGFIDPIYGWGQISTSSYVSRIMEKLDDTFKKRTDNAPEGLTKFAEENSAAANSIKNSMNSVLNNLKLS